MALSALQTKEIKASMNKLSIKIFFILLPLAACILGFGYAYYKAREKLTIDHIFRSSQLSAVLGANEISHYVEGRFIEFDRLSSVMNLCAYQPTSLPELSSNALSFTNGFSALLISDLSGRVSHFHLSSNRSNRYVMRQNLNNARILSSNVLELLNGSFEEWQLNYPRNQAREQEVLSKILGLQEHGEENSQANRDLSTQLNKLRQKRNLPKQVLSLASSEVTTRLGLIFDNDTYFYSRPLIDCNKDLVGYYTAVLDRTLIEDLIFDIKRSLTESGLEFVDVFMIRNNGLQSLSSSRYMRLDRLKRNGLNPTTSPVFRQDLGGIMINQPIGLDIKKHLVFDDNISLEVEQQGVTLLVFVSDKEINKHNATLLQEVLIYITMGLLLFVSLILYLSHFIASPISELRGRISTLSKVGTVNTQSPLRHDEIGDLFSAFSDMADKIQQKESELTRLAREDSLTGVLNRRALVNSAEELRHLNATCCICMMDLDNFKQVNDVCGHATGDEVLIEFCRLVNGELRSSDSFGRLGGEEFGLLLPETAIEEALQIAERIRLRVELGLADKLCSSHVHPVTVSIGLVDWPKDQAFAQALVRADNCLYQAKHSGRNQIAVGK